MDEPAVLAFRVQQVEQAQVWVANQEGQDGFLLPGEGQVQQRSDVQAGVLIPVEFFPGGCQAKSPGKAMQRFVRPHQYAGASVAAALYARRCRDGQADYHRGPFLHGEIPRDCRGGNGPDGRVCKRSGDILALGPPGRNWPISNYR